MSPLFSAGCHALSHCGQLTEGEGERERENDGGHEGRESAQCSQSNGQSFTCQQVFDILVCVLQLVLRKIISTNVLLSFSDFLVGAD